MASLYIKDSDTADLVRRVAARSGMTNTALIRELAKAREAELDRGERRIRARDRLERFWREHPLPPPTGLKADKAFFDELSGDL
jgi:antitoxin VapB